MIKYWRSFKKALYFLHFIINSLMDRNSKSISVKQASMRYYKNLSVHDSEDKYLGQSPHGYNCYIANGIASLNTSIIDIYFIFFHSAYNKQYGAQQFDKRKGKNQKENHLSQFYKAFMEYMCITSTIGTVDPIKVEHKIEEFKRQLFYYQHDAQLLDISANLAVKYFTSLKKYLEKEDRTITIGQLYLELKDRYRTIRQSLLEQAKLKQLFFNQWLPVGIKEIPEVGYFVQRTFLRLQNIYAPEISKRTELLKKFSSEMKNIFRISLPYFQNAKFRDDQKYKNYIIISKSSNKDEAFITGLDQYLNFQMILKNKIGPQKKELAADVFMLVQTFYKDAKLEYTYPYIKVQDLVFNQKTLKPQIRETSLIYEGLGLHKNTNSIQLELAVNSTPLAIQYQKCYIQFDRKFMWQLQKKYYCPFGLRWTQSEQQQQQQQQSQLGRIYEKVYVWRLLCILYYILHNKQHLIKKIYNERYRKVFQITQKSDPPFYFDRYQELLKETYQNLSNNSKEIKYRILKKPRKLIKQNETNQQNQLSANQVKQTSQVQQVKQVKQELSNQQRQQQQINSKFDFTMKQIQQYLGLDTSGDSMVQKLQFQSVKGQFYIRHALSKQTVTLMVNQKRFFANMINVRKYVVMFNVTLIESVYQIIFLIWSERKKNGSRKMILNNIKQYRGVNFQKQELTRIGTMQSSIKKVREYNQRQPNDLQRKYLKNNEFIANSFQSGYRDYQTILLKNSELKNYETATTTNRQPYEIKMNQVQQLAKGLINNAYTSLTLFLQDFVSQGYDVNQFHMVKNEPIPKKDEKIYLLINLKLVICIKSFLKLTTNNWREYQFFLLNYLIDEKKDAKPRTRTVNPKQKQAEIETLQRNLHIAQEFILFDDQVKNYDQLKKIKVNNLQRNSTESSTIVEKI